MESKKQIIVLVLRILETESDRSHPITQIKIADIISQKYPCDRKTVGRNIAFLKELGYPIVKAPKGYYMDKRCFSREEVSFLIELVKNSETDAVDKNNLCDRLFECLSRYYVR